MIMDIALAIKGLTFRDLWEPSVLISSLFFQALYLYVAYGPGRHWFPDSQPVAPKKTFFFILSMWVYYFTFGSPLDYLSDHVSFAMHMVQHMSEVMLMTPLFILGATDWMVRPILRFRPTARLFRMWTHPIVALITFNIVFSTWHAPLLYDATLRNGYIHFSEHLMFFVFAIPLWWPILSPLPEVPSLWPPKKQMFYLFFAMDFMMPISVYLTLANHPWFAYPYAHDWRLQALGLTPLGDQQWGGIIMIAAGLVAYGWAFLWNFLRDPGDSWD